MIGVIGTEAYGMLLMRYWIKHNATISHHHGIGLLRAPYMSLSLGSALDIMRKIKNILDPQHILNPGKLGLDADTLS